MSYKPTMQERETTINWGVLDECATVDTSDIKIIHRMDKLCADHPESYRCIRNEYQKYGSKVYECPCGLIAIRKPPTAVQVAAWRKNGQANKNRLLSRH